MKFSLSPLHFRSFSDSEYRFEHVGLSLIKHLRYRQWYIIIGINIQYQLINRGISSREPR